MKKPIALLLCLLMLLSLTACARQEVDPELVITRAPAEETVQVITGAEDTETQSAEIALVDRFTFVAGGVELVPGAAFDPAVLPAASSVYEVPSCAIVGTDNVYNYETFELTAFDDGTGEVIYSILLLDPNIATTEGLALGDPASRVTELYGEGYTQEGTARVYSGEGTLLYVIVQGEYVASIEYRMET